MHAFTTAADIPAVDFDEPGDAAQFFHWHKHPNLHGWMETLYREKGGTDPDFNLTPVRLELAGLDELEAAVKADRLPFTMGFFFGKSRQEHRELDLDFIQKARAALADEQKLFYISWW